jgi:PKD repeat protein
MKECPNCSYKNGNNTLFFNRGMISLKLMDKRQIETLFLITCLNLIAMPVVLGEEITVNPTSGTDVQTAINNAIDYVALNTTSGNLGYVLLTAGTYKISAPIVLKSNVVLKGEGDDTIIFANGSICNSIVEPAYVFGSDVSNVEVCNLQFKSTAIGPSDGGHGDYRNCIQFISSSNSSVHDILFTRYLFRDGVISLNSSGINVYNCRMYSTGHDGVAFVSHSKNCRMYNCDVQVQTNTGARIDKSENCELDHNTFSGSFGSGWCCVELENTLTDANIHHNIMHDFRGSSNNAGVGNVHASGSINVHDNVMWNVSPYIQVGSGTNILGPSDHNVANWMGKGYGYNSTGNLNNVQQLPIANFISSVSFGNVPLKVQFTDTSTETPTSWLWDFGDKTTSTEQNPTHSYSKQGNYTVSLTAYNIAGSNTVTKSSYIIANTLRSPIPAFSASSTSGKAPLTVAFTDKSTGAPTSWIWNFGDGKNSTIKNPVHEYTKAGKYTVSLMVKNAVGSNILRRTSYIIVK